MRDRSGPTTRHADLVGDTAERLELVGQLVDVGFGHAVRKRDRLLVVIVGSVVDCVDGDIFGSRSVR
ncbi:hypothetical protein [Natronococcus sp.]|uniref:hypothetical protein n=1 Tax=Natronococcus sp. TaxID=35747 RepID=UPI003A4DF7F9